MKVLINSLNTDQINLLGEQLNSRFSVFSESGFSSHVPLPKQTAAETLLRYYNTEEDIIQLFTYMLRHEGLRFHNRPLNIWGKVEFIKLLSRYKLIFDDQLAQFFLDPFYEHEINFLKNMRIIDLRSRAPIQKIIKDITKISKKLSIHDLEWRITLRIYDLDPKIGSLIRKVIDLLLIRQNLNIFTHPLFTCLKELILNASKANYKILFEKFITSKQQVTTQNNYFHFLRLFKEEIDEHGNQRLLKLAKKEDKFINITFQSTIDSIEMWVTNTENISIIEKQELLKKIEGKKSKAQLFNDEDDDYAEGAGLGLTLVLSILKNYSKSKKPLKVIFYPNFIKIGFLLKRDELEEVS